MIQLDHSLERPVETGQHEPSTLAEAGVLTQELFLHFLHAEGKRAERSRRRSILMLLECGTLLKSNKNARLLEKVLVALSRSTRETDIKGWYKSGETIGVIFTEIGPADGKAVAAALLAKVHGVLGAALGIDEINEIRLSFHQLPEGVEADSGDPTGRRETPRFGPKAKLLSDFAKRATDVVLSALALLVFSPLLAVIAILVKITSAGPVLFRQERVGYRGNKFVCLKFRSMCTGNDATAHREYVARLIAGQAEPASSDTRTFKLTNDPRVTPLGRFLRKTSLDEFPQFFNVLKGEMSLVGPRPPIPYEVDCYESWHLRRLMAAKPGITGLWQVRGRSRTTFDEMVRLDLQYVSSWSIWLDLLILMQTPLAVLSGSGAH